MRAGHGCLGLLHEVGKLSLIGVQGALGQPLQSLFEASDTLVTQLTPLQSDLGSDESEHQLASGHMAAVSIRATATGTDTSEAAWSAS